MARAKPDTARKVLAPNRRLERFAGSHGMQQPLRGDGHIAAVGGDLARDGSRIIGRPVGQTSIVS